MNDPQPHLPTILVVEDEPLVRELAVDLLEDMGACVLQAVTADEAIARLADFGNLAGVLTDVQMPGDADGIDLAHKVRSLYPDACIVVTSGRSNVEGAKLPARATFLKKPWDYDQLLNAMRGAIAH